MIKTIKNEIKDFQEQIRLLKKSGETSVKIYNDCKVIIHDLGEDKITPSMIQTLSNYYKTSEFIVEYFIDKAKRYHSKQL